MGIVEARFVHPDTKAELRSDVRGNLFDPSRPGVIVFAPKEGCYDFASSPWEAAGDRDFYDLRYESLSGEPRRLSVEELRAEWDAETGFQALLAAMGDVRGKKILLLGNGMSSKEFYFVAMGAKVVYTDLSISGVLRMKGLFSQSDLGKDCPKDIEFHAVDALRLPFADETFDVVYGCAFAHHLEDLNPFLAETRRCLAPGGKCLFFDDAYCRVWHFAKGTILRPLQMLAHARSGISPEDKRATRKGGYRRSEIEELMATHRFRSMIYRRTSFFEYILGRGSDKFFRRAKPLLARTGRCLDKSLAGRTSFLSTQGIRLIWGFVK